MTTRLEVVEATELTSIEAIKDAMETAYGLLDTGLAQVSLLQALMQEHEVGDFTVKFGNEVIFDLTGATDVLNVARIQILDAFLQLGEATTALRNMPQMHPGSLAA